MKQSDILRACRIPDSVDPYGFALFFVPVRTMRRGTGYIDYCEPAPAQPHEAEALVPTGETSKPSRLASGVAAARGATVSNLVGAICEQNAPTSTDGAVTHRDLSQHADSYTPDRFEIVPHGALDR